MMPCMLSVPARNTIGEHRQPGGNFVADDLRRRAHAAEQRPFVVRRPAGHENADDDERSDRQQIENADVEIGDDQVGAERNDDEGAKKTHEDDIGRQRKQFLIRRGWNDVFLHDVFDAVGEPLENPLRPDPVRPDSRLHARPHAPLEPTGHAGEWRDEDGKHHQRRQHHTDGIDDLRRHAGEGAVFHHLVKKSLHVEF